MTPFLVKTQDFVDFNSYIRSLAKTGRKNFRFVYSQNLDLSYAQVRYHKPDVERFMDIWSKQKIHGNEPVRWGYDIGHVNNLNERGLLKVFQASKGNDIVAMHFVEDHKGYVYAHPPMYDKSFGSERYLAKYMWFGLIKYMIENKMGFLDLGSGDRGTWRDLVMNRSKYPRVAYKWLYVPEAVKQNPDVQLPYIIAESNGSKFITISQ